MNINIHNLTDKLFDYGNIDSGNRISNKFNDHLSSVGKKISEEVIKNMKVENNSHKTHNHIKSYRKIVT